MQVFYIDMYLGYIPSAFALFTAEAFKPSPHKAALYKRRLFLQAIISPFVLVLILFALKRIFLEMDTRYIYLTLLVYFPAAAFIHYRDDPAVSYVVERMPEERDLRLQLRIVKLMSLAWALFIFGIQLLLPINAH